MQKSRLVELAIKGLEAEKARIEEEIASIRKQVAGRATAPRGAAHESPRQAAPAHKSRRRMSAAARKKISEAMKRSHAQRKAAAAAKK